jgi:membrane-anchored protein YejM (alkaline phosphatase superfamily)
MNKQTRNWLLIGAGVGVAYFLFFAKKKITISAYDGSQQTLDVESSLSASAQQQITAFFGASGTMMNSLNPANDEAALLTSLRGQGYSTAAASVDALYKKLITGAQLTSGYSAGAYGDLAVFNGLRPMIDFGQGPGR